MTPQFTIQDGYLKELPRIEKPYHLPYGVSNQSVAYEEHLKTLRTYRLANPSDWDNVPMPIGEDGFEVKERWEKELYPNGNYTGVKSLVKFAIPTQPAKGQEEFYLPPDHGDICWQEGAETFTRKEVYYLLWTQRAMMGNDIKQTGTASSEVMEVIESPRMPKY